MLKQKFTRLVYDVQSLTDSGYFLQSKNWIEGHQFRVPNVNYDMELMLMKTLRFVAQLKTEIKFISSDLYIQ
jgi:hypothetical protein